MGVSVGGSGFFVSQRVSDRRIDLVVSFGENFRYGFGLGLAGALLGFGLGFVRSGCVHGPGLLALGLVCDCGAGFDAGVCLGRIDAHPYLMAALFRIFSCPIHRFLDPHTTIRFPSIFGDIFFH